MNLLRAIATRAGGLIGADLVATFWAEPRRHVADPVLAGLAAYPAPQAFRNPSAR